MQLKRPILWLLIAAITVMMTACGGGSGGSGATAQDIARDKIEAYADTNGTNGQLPTLSDYESATGQRMPDLNITAINDYIKNLTEEEVDTVQKIKDIAAHFGITLVDTDNDGIPNGLDPDIDGDGVENATDAFPEDANETIDTDGDGVGNNADRDDDGDGASDDDEQDAGSDPLDPDSLSFKGLAYNVLTSSYTGRKWLDRNLGATMVCDRSRDDTETPYADNDAYMDDQNGCFGGYFQWGRKYNGHEKSTDTSDIQLESDSEQDGIFITHSDTWRVDRDDLLWYGSLAENSICPIGFNVPTFAELNSETIEQGVDDRDSAFANFLHLPASGAKMSDGSMYYPDDLIGAVWSSDIQGSSGSAQALTYNASGASNSTFIKTVYGAPVRCIKSTVVNDAEAPEVEHIQPTNTSLALVVRIEFSEPISHSTLVKANFSVKKTSDNTPLDFNLSETGLVAYIMPIDLAYATAYTVSIGSGISDLAGNALVPKSQEFFTTDTIDFDGASYKVVTSPYTQKQWLDRNMGASQACTNPRSAFGSNAEYIADQQNCFGDYYQWGRLRDGHQIGTSDTTTTLADDVNNVGHGDFITNDVDPKDWASVDDEGLIRESSWSKTDGTTICPAGFRAPTIGELNAELIDAGTAEIKSNHTEKEGNSDSIIENAYNSFLRLPVSGNRANGDGLLYRQGQDNLTWTSSLDGSGDYAAFLNISDSGTGTVYGSLAHGYSVRCIHK
jgi:uncharacterized protein (TIGR02145 family)